MTLEALQAAVSQIFGHLQLSSVSGIAYAFVIIGLGLLLGVIVVGGAVLIARGVKAIGNLTPGRFVAVLITLAIVLIIAGALFP
ncbi:MAG: hypothetical protein ACP5HK_01260 [Acidilobus sp.]